MYKYFSYDPETGFEYHATKEEAIRATEELLDLYRSEASGDGWSEAVEGLVWGEIKQQTVAFDLRPITDEEFGYGLFEETCDYKLEDI